MSGALLFNHCKSSHFSLCDLMRPNHSSALMLLSSHPSTGGALKLVSSLYVWASSRYLVACSDGMSSVFFFRRGFCLSFYFLLRSSHSWPKRRWSLSGGPCLLRWCRRRWCCGTEFPFWKVDQNGFRMVSSKFPTDNSRICKRWSSDVFSISNMLDNINCNDALRWRSKFL